MSFLSSVYESRQLRHPRGLSLPPWAWRFPEAGRELDEDVGEGEKTAEWGGGGVEGEGGVDSGPGWGPPSLPPLAHLQTNVW